MRAPIYLFDGDCVLCSRAVRYVLEHEREAAFRFVAITSAEGRALAAANGIDPDNPETFLYVDENGRALGKSDAILALTRTGDTSGGLLHLSNAEPCTWWDFARAILDGAGYTHLEIDRVSTDAFPTPAVRPACSVLDTAKARGLGIEMRSWREALADYLASEDFRALHQNLREEVATAS